MPVYGLAITKKSIWLSSTIKGFPKDGVFPCADIENSNFHSGAPRRKEEKIF
jgi:hypothetical protein